MAKKSSIINVVVTGDAKQFKKAIGTATTSLTNFGKKAAQVGAVAAAAMAGLGAKAIDLAVDFEESLSKAQQIFGEGAKSIETAADGAATAVGMSSAEFLEAASGFGVFGKAAGLTGEELSTFSTDLVTVAADVASFNNLRPEEALEKLSAGLRGSNEPLQSIGVLINAAAIEAKALEMGLADANGEISEGNKIMARQALILEQLGSQGALGDFARTSEGLANQQRILSARFKDLGIEIGTKLLPIAAKVMEWFMELVDIGERIVGVYNEKGVSGVLEALGEEFKKLWKVVKAEAPKIGKKLFELGERFVNWVTPKIPLVIQKLGEWGSAILRWITNTAIPGIGNAMVAVAAAFLTFADKIVAGAPDAIIKITDWILGDEEGDFGPAVLTAFGDVVKKIGPQLLGVLRNIFLPMTDDQDPWGSGGAIANVMQRLGEDLGQHMTEMAAKLGVQWDKDVEFLVNGLTKLPSAAKSALTWVGLNLARPILESFETAMEDMATIIETALTAVAIVLKEAWNGIANAWNLTVAGEVFKVPWWLSALGGIGGSIANKSWTIPSLNTFDLTPMAAGGIVTGPTPILAGEAGPEAIIPLNKMGMMGNITINVHGVSGEEVIEAIQRETRKRGAAAVPVDSNRRL